MTAPKTRVGILCVTRSHGMSLIPFIVGMSRLNVECTVYSVGEIKNDLLAKLSSFDVVAHWTTVPTSSPQDILDLTKKALADSSKFDLLFVDTFGGTIIDFSLLRPKCPAILTLHDINRFFLPLRRLLKGQFRRVVYNLRILHHFDALNVPSANMAEHLRRMPFQNKLVLNIPWTLYEPRSACSVVDKITFTVSGYVQLERRDYVLLLNAWEKFDRQHGGKARLVVLGRPVGETDRKITQRCARMCEKGADIIYFEDYVPTDVFEDHLKQTDMLIAPQRPTFSYPDFPEFYSKTKSSGEMFDRLRFGIPGIVPYYYVPDRFMRSATLKYRDENDLAETMGRLGADHSELNQLKKEARLASSRFELDSVTEYLRDNVLPLTGKLGR